MLTLTHVLLLDVVLVLCLLLHGLQLLLGMMDVTWIRHDDVGAIWPVRCVSLDQRMGEPGPPKSSVRQDLSR